MNLANKIKKFIAAQSKIHDDEDLQNILSLWAKKTIGPGRPSGYCFDYDDMVIVEDVLHINASTYYGYGEWESEQMKIPMAVLENPSEVEKELTSWLNKQEEDKKRARAAREAKDLVEAEKRDKETYERLKRKFERGW